MAALPHSLNHWLDLGDKAFALSQNQYAQGAQHIQPQGFGMTPSSAVINQQRCVQVQGHADGAALTQIKATHVQRMRLSGQQPSVGKRRLNALSIGQSRMFQTFMDNNIRDMHMLEQRGQKPQQILTAQGHQRPSIGDNQLIDQTRQGPAPIQRHPS